MRPHAELKAARLFEQGHATEQRREERDSFKVKQSSLIAFSGKAENGFAAENAISERQREQTPIGLERNSLCRGRRNCSI